MKRMKKIIVDIDVWNCQIRASKREIQTYMPNNDVGKMIFWNYVNSERLNKKTYARLKGREYRKAERIVDKFGAINISGQDGSIEVAEAISYQIKFS